VCLVSLELVYLCFKVNDNILGFHGDSEDCHLRGCGTVALVRTDVSEECSSYIIRVTFIGELGRALVKTSTLFLRSVRRLLVTRNAVPRSPIPVTLMMNELSSFETSVLT
jgi:hypothetical protein